MTSTPQMGGSCEHCGRRRRVLMVMTPGADGKSWTLCLRCYLDGLRPMVEPKPTPAPVVPVDREMAEALEKSGWKRATSVEEHAAQPGRHKKA